MMEGSNKKNLLIKLTHYLRVSPNFSIFPFFVKHTRFIVGLVSDALLSTATCWSISNSIYVKNLVQLLVCLFFPFPFFLQTCFEFLTLVLLCNKFFVGLTLFIPSFIRFHTSLYRGELRLPMFSFHTLTTVYQFEFSHPFAHILFYSDTFTMK